MTKTYKYRDIFSKVIKTERNFKKAHELTKYTIAKNFKAIRGKKYKGRLSYAMVKREKINYENKLIEIQKIKEFESKNKELSDIVRVGKSALIKGLQNGHTDEDEDYNFIPIDNIDYDREIQEYQKTGVVYEDEDEIKIMYTMDYNKRINHRLDVEVVLVYNKHSKIFSKVESAKVHRKDYKGLSASIMRWLQ